MTQENTKTINHNTKSLPQLWQRWQRQSGLIKKLELALILSLGLITCLGIQVFDSSQKLEEAQKPYTQKETHKQEEYQYSEEEIKTFSQEYLEKFFQITDEAEKFLLEHTENKFYQEHLVKQVLKRRELQLNSKLEILDLLIEADKGELVKIYCTGIENFSQEEFQDRNIHIQLIINSKTKSVINIPIFEIK